MLLRSKPLELQLDAVEKRVLASLLEKEITTPDYYPLTLNALLAACNQKSNRDPVMELEESALRQALHRLQEKGLAGVARDEGRVARFEHRLSEVLNLGRRESALLCTLLLRGPQTPGELRGRSERMHRLEDLDEAQLVLQKLIEHDPPLVKLLPRQPGTKEARYVDLLGAQQAEPGGGVAASGEDASHASHEQAPQEQRITALESEIRQLRTELETLRQQFADFRRQFES
jgi:uncharacterized protein YceH (UPF0502 family)